jgi:hypothetical protein
MSFGLDAAVLVAAELVERLVRAARIRIGLGPFGNIDVRLNTPFTAESIDTRLEKIETARESLTDALSAIDELKLTAEANKRDLDTLVSAIARAESDKADLNAQLDELRKLAAIDTDAVREALRIPTEVEKWKERIWGFLIGGIVAGLVTSAIWDFVIKPRVESTTINHVSDAVRLLK